MKSAKRNRALRNEINFLKVSERKRNQARKAARLNAHASTKLDETLAYHRRREASNQLFDELWEAWNERQRGEA